MGIEAENSKVYAISNIDIFAADEEPRGPSGCVTAYHERRISSIRYIYNMKSRVGIGNICIIVRYENPVSPVLRIEAAYNFGGIRDSDIDYL